MGRLQNFGEDSDTSHPVFFPGAYVTKLIVDSSHDSSMHAGASQVLADLRQTYYIPRGRQVVRTILSKCVICKKVQGRAFPQPAHAPLPAERVNERRPFQVTGLDHTGALFVRDHGGKITKVYVVLFT